MAEDQAERILDRGLVLSDTEHTTPEEVEAFRTFYANHLGYALPAFDFWFDNDRPDVLKHYRLQAYYSDAHIWTAFAMVHHYSVIGYEDGILYETRNVRGRGATKEQVLEAFAVAFLHAGPRGMRYVSTAVGDYMRDYTHSGVTPEWPEGWAPDPQAFKSGIDFSRQGLSDDDLRNLEQWYERTCGEVPKHVRFLARHRPDVLKANRLRFENAIRDGLPKQMMPYFQIQWNVSRGFAGGIREAVLMGRGFGMTDAQLVDAVVWGMGYHGGAAAIDVVVDAVGDVLPSVADVPA